ncbi:hypothetical protein C7B62_09660 [Pleurocapsa sp. CCALA 161]|nr:hypothetical protein C7B62_09660 [Pleurocapsa sp. CCALA 161]
MSIPQLFTNSLFSGFSLHLLSVNQAWNTNFNQSILTGACLENTKIDDRTSFAQVICQYLYKNHDQQQRLPENQQDSLSSSDFETMLQDLMDAIEVTFNEDINWKIMLDAFESLQQKYQSHKIHLKSVEANANYRFVVRIIVKPSTKTAAIAQSFRQEYNLLALAKQNFATPQDIQTEQKIKQELSKSYKQN